MNDLDRMTVTVHNWRMTLRGDSPMCDVSLGWGAPLNDFIHIRGLWFAWDEPQGKWALCFPNASRESGGPLVRVSRRIRVEIVKAATPHLERMSRSRVA